MKIKFERYLSKILLIARNAQGRCGKPPLQEKQTAQLLIAALSPASGGGLQALQHAVAADQQQQVFQFGPVMLSGDGGT